MALLTVDNLTVLADKKAIVKDVSFVVDHQEIFALVGGSGSGKTTIGLSIINMLSSTLIKKNGSILFNNQKNFRPGRDVGMVFQEPLYAFNPVYTIGFQINEVLFYHTKLTSSERKNRILDLLDIVGIDEPERVRDSYPHQLSGGMRQRAMIAQAIAADPKLIIADEPTSNLDVTLQAMVMALFHKLRRDLGLSIILITHDLGVVQHFAENAIVLNHGEVVERGSVDQLFKEPKHMLTKSLVAMLYDY